MIKWAFRLYEIVMSFWGSVWNHTSSQSDFSGFRFGSR